MRPHNTTFFALAAALLAMLAVPSAGSAAERKVPFGFFGTVLSQELTNPGQVSPETLDQQMASMARSGVESARYSMTWADTEIAPGAYNWERPDRIVAAAARHRIALLLNVLLTPTWASSRPEAEKPYIYPPENPADFGRFMTQMVRRYGPKGSFWALNPDLPRVPVRQWQIWNEQMAPWMWGPRPWAESYTLLLKSAYRAIHRADRGAKVTAGSLVAYYGLSQWGAMSQLYRAGAKGFFDAIAVHPFTSDPGSERRTVDNTLLIIERVRARMRARGQGRVPIAVTELTWPASAGRIFEDKLLGIETTPSGQRQRLKAGYAGLAKERRRLHLSRIYWYTWASEYDANSPGTDVTFRFSGLNRFAGGVFEPLPLLSAYARVAAKYEGCRKGPNARACLSG